MADWVALPILLRFMSLKMQMGEIYYSLICLLLWKAISVWPAVGPEFLSLKKTIALLLRSSVLACR